MSRRLWVDVALAAAAVAVDTVLFTVLSQEDDQVGWAGNQPGWLVIGAGVVSVPVLSCRRRFPTLVCLVMSGYSVGVTVWLGSRPLVSLLVALYAAAVWCSTARALLCLGAVLGAHSVAVAYEGAFPNVSIGDVALVALVYGLLDLAAWGAGRWGAGAAARARTRELESSRARLAAEAVATERMRIARELHDIVAHAVTGMTLQAAGARRILTSDPERVAQSLDAVQDLGRQAIAELRRLLAVLRAGVDESVTSSTEHGIRNLPELVRDFEWSGLTVRVVTLGAAVTLDPSVDLTAYRVVQEALTNVAKHAGSHPSATVTLQWRPHELSVEVANQTTTTQAGLGQPSPSGFGLVGLQERVRLVGGTFAAAQIDSRFVVQAHLPTHGAAASLAALPGARPAP